VFWAPLFGLVHLGDDAGLIRKWYSCRCQYTRATTSVDRPLGSCFGPTYEPAPNCPVDPVPMELDSEGDRVQWRCPEGGRANRRAPAPACPRVDTLGAQHARDHPSTKLVTRQGVGCVVEAIWGVIHRQYCLIRWDFDGASATVPTERRTKKLRERLGTISAPPRHRSLTGGAAGVSAFFAQLCAHYCPQMPGACGLSLAHSIREHSRSAPRGTSVNFSTLVNEQPAQRQRPGASRAHVTQLATRRPQSRCPKPRDCKCNNEERACAI